MGYSKEDAAKETGVSAKEVSGAWHQAKDDAQKAGELNERMEAKISQGYEKLARDSWNSGSESSSSGK